MDIGSSESCPPKARILLWKDLSYSDAEEITKTESISEISRILCQALHLDTPEPQRGILLELYTNMVLFCRQQKFSKEQTSVLLSIVRSMHQINTETPLNNMDQCFTYCTELLLCHSVKRPPFSIDLFDSEQMTKIMKYLINTYMRHYLLYKYVFTPQIYLDLSLSYTGMPEELTTEQLETSDVAETVNETETEADEASEQEMTFADILLTETEESKQDLSQKGELQTIVQKEVQEEVMRLTAHLEKRLEESTVHLNTAIAALETKLQPRK